MLSLYIDMHTHNPPGLPVSVIGGSGITTPGYSGNHSGERVSVCVHVQGRGIIAY